QSYHHYYTRPFKSSPSRTYLRVSSVFVSHKPPKCASNFPPLPLSPFFLLLLLPPQSIAIVAKPKCAARNSTSATSATTALPPTSSSLATSVALSCRPCAAPVMT